MSSRGKSYKEKIKLGWGSDIDRGDNLGKVGRKSFKKYSDIEVNTWMKWESEPSAYLEGKNYTQRKLWTSPGWEHALKWVGLSGVSKLRLTEDMVRGVAGDQIRQVLLGPG